MALFATLQRKPHKPSDLVAAPAVAVHPDAALPIAGRTASALPAVAPRAFVPIPLFRPDVPIRGETRDEGTMSVADALEAHGAASEAVRVVQRARMTVKQVGSGAAAAPGGGGGLPVQRKNTTGLPDALKAGIEALSGVMLDDVRVRYNSAKPATVQAAAYTQGAEIHIGPGQKRHLAHEAWHAVQQKQRQVTPTLRADGVAINDDPALEREADAMGAQAMQMKAMPGGADIAREAARLPLAPISPHRQDVSIQRYLDVGGGTRYSDGHHIMLLNKQSLWAQDGQLEEANRILTTKGAYILLKATGTTIESAFGGTLREVRPTWNTAKPTRRQDRERIRLQNQNATAGDGFVAHADCFMNAQTVMWVADTPIGKSDTTRPYMGSGDDRSVVKALSMNEMNDRFGGTGLASALGGGSPSRGHYALILAAFPKFFTWLASDTGKAEGREVAAAAFLVKYGPLVSKGDKERLYGMLRAYADLRKNDAYAPLRDSFSRMFGINEYLSPEIGEGLAVLNDPDARKKNQDAITEGTVSPDEELWNYHFAGVVMKDGGDYVTLENYSVGDDGVDNGHWLFQMYGMGKQSFHTEMSGKKGIGGEAMTLGFTTDKPTI